METAFRESLLDPAYWRPRLRRLDETPRELALFPRPDLERPGIEVLELRLRGHDGRRLRGLFARSSFAARGAEVELRLAEFLGPEAVDWSALETGGPSALVLERATERRLEDRVLDVLRIAGTAGELEAVEEAHLRFGAGDGGKLDDELLLAERICERGWLHQGH